VYPVRQLDVLLVGLPDVMPTKLARTAEPFEKCAYDETDRGTSSHESVRTLFTCVRGRAAVDPTRQAGSEMGEHDGRGVPDRRVWSLSVSVARPARVGFGCLAEAQLHLLGVLDNRPVQRPLGLIGLLGLFDVACDLDTLLAQLRTIESLSD
jgi:hypothetical protein